jgi:hypothetical protein
LQFEFVERMDAVLPLAFVQNPLDFPYQPRKRTKKRVQPADSANEKDSPHADESRSVTGITATASSSNEV